MAVNGDGSEVALAAGNILKIYELISGTYQFSQDLTLALDIRGIEISRDSTFLVVGMKSGALEVYQKIGGIYTFFQNLSTGGGDQEGIYMSDDNLKLVVGDTNGLVRIYDYLVGVFTQSQNFTLPDIIRTVKLVNTNLMVSGEELIHFYEWDGSSYAFTMTIDEG